MMMFDLEKDLAETTDLSGTDPELFEEMKSALEKIKKSWFYSREGLDYTY